MLRTGSVILSLWIVLNLVPSLAILVNTTFLGGNAPGLSAILGDDEIRTLSEDVLATANSIAIWANGLNVAFCLLALTAIWMGLNRGLRWAFWGLLASFTAAVTGGIAADNAVRMAFPEINIISAMIVLAGLASSALGLFRKKPGI